MLYKGLSTRSVTELQSPKTFCVVIIRVLSSTRMSSKSIMLLLKSLSKMCYAWSTVLDLHFPCRYGHAVASHVPQLLVRMAAEIASGMDYLAKRQFVHRVSYMNMHLLSIACSDVLIAVMC